MPPKDNEFNNQRSNGTFLPSRSNNNVPDNACTKKFDSMFGKGFEAKEVNLIGIFDEFGIHSEIFSALSNPELKKILITISREVFALEKIIFLHGLSSPETQKLILEIREKIKGVTEKLVAFKNQCDGLMDARRQEALDKMLEWLKGKDEKLNKQSIKRPKMNTLSDNLVEFSQFSVNLPDKFLRKVNSLASNLLNPLAQKLTKAQSDAEIRKGQIQEIKRRKNEANQDTITKFGTEALVFILRNPLYLLK